MPTPGSTMPPVAYETDDARWAAVQARDARADGSFVYAVRTTGVYCRPSSSARLPRRENVRFFDTPEAAEAAGFRPSRRASADRTVAASRRAELVAQACRQIETAPTPPSLKALAIQAGVSGFHFSACSRRKLASVPRPMRMHFAPSGCVTSWRERPPSLRRFTMPGLIPIAGFTRRPTVCWECVPRTISQVESIQTYVL